MLAITASNPISKGILAGTDCRWDTIAASVDCRTRQERGLEPITPGMIVQITLKCHFTVKMGYCLVVSWCTYIRPFHQLEDHGGVRSKELSPFVGPKSKT